MKRIFALFVIVTLFVASLFAVKINGIYYNLDNSTKTAEVTYKYLCTSDNYWGITSITIPEKVTYNSTEYSVTSIGEYAFYDCEALTSITIGNSVTYIGDFAFEYCSSLRDVTIGNSVTSIGNYAFAGCSSLRSITIPNSVTHIGNYAFDSSLTSINIEATIPPIGEKYTFNYVNNKNIPVTVPCGSLSAYQSAKYWSEFTNFRESFPYTLFAITADATMGNVTIKTAPACGVDAVIKATPNEGYHFVKWSDGNTENPRTITVTADVTLTAEFAINQYNVEVTSIGNGLVNYVNGIYNHGDEITITATPNKNYHFVKWSDGNTENPRTIVVTEDVELMAEFAINQYEVSVTSDENGYVTGSGTYDYGTEVTIEALANEGYHFVKWSDENTENPRTIVVTEDVELTAEFAINQYKVNVTESENGYVTGSGTYDYGTEVMIKAIANEGYHFVQWLDGNSENPRTIVVTEDVTLTAEFVINQYNVEVTSIGNGLVNYVNGVYNHGDEITITATPNENYHFVKWSDGNTENPRTIVVTEDVELKAEFAINQYEVSVTSGENGYVTGSGTYDYGTEVIIEAVANEGYHFVKWSDGNTENPRTIVVTEDVELMAEFALNQYEVNVTSDENGYVTGSGTYDYGTEVTIEAIANEGYRFVQWSDGNIENPRTIVVVEDIEMRAEFEEDGKTLVDNVDESSVMIYVQNGVIYVEGAETDYHVLDAAGRLIYSGCDAQLSLPRGVYVVVVGDEVEKVVL